MAIVDSRIVGQSRSTKIFYAVVRALVVGLCRILLRLRVVGLENVPKTGAFVFAPTHRSTIDIPVASAATAGAATVPALFPKVSIVASPK